MTGSEIEERLIALENKSHSALPWFGVAWSLLCGLVAAAFFIAQLASAQASLARTVASLEATVHEHINLPGHPTEVERTESLRQRVDRLERRFR